ncbi:MAG: YerC/YecD family TrpR-related protein [Oscillospiraceae bacterium]|nr:YerC/YecD family TrpR-related protein [Oscillospiraceae bacterium]
MKENKTKNAEFLFEVMSKLRTPEECRIVFEDLCTIKEVEAISQRLYVAKLLHEKHVYNDIVKMTGASTATISRVNRSLQSGSGGYDVVFKRLTQETKQEHE